MISGKRHAEIIRDLERRHAIERATWAKRDAVLLDRIMLLAGKPIIPELGPAEPEPDFSDLESAADQIFDYGGPDELADAVKELRLT